MVHKLGLCEGLLKRMYWGAMRVQPGLSIASLVRLASDDVIPGLDAVYRQFLFIRLGHELAGLLGLVQGIFPTLPLLLHSGGMERESAFVVLVDGRILSLRPQSWASPVCTIWVLSDLVLATSVRPALIVQVSVVSLGGLLLHVLFVAWHRKIWLRTWRIR